MQVNNRNIAFDRFGEGEPVLLVHGLGGTSNFWRPVVNAFADRFDLIVPDLPSSGRSDIDEHVSIESLANDLFALLDQLGIEKTRLVGHSMGTIVCQHMTAAQPDRIVDMVLLGPLAEPPEAARTAIRDRASAARNGGMADIAEAIANGAIASETKADLPNVQGFVREMVLRQPAEGYAASCLALAAAKAADLSAVGCRSLLVTGDQDGVAPEANVRVLGQSLSQSEMRVLPACGHWTLTEQPTAVIAVMQQFYA